MDKLPPIILNNFILNNSFSEALLPMNTLRFALNMRLENKYNTLGKATSRVGMFPWRNVDDDIAAVDNTDSLCGLFSPSADDLIVGVQDSGASAYTYFSDAGGAFANIGTTPFNWSITGSQKMRFCQYLGYTFCANGTYVRSWDGVLANDWGTTNLTSAPTGNIIVEFQGRLYITQNTSNTSRVYFSGLPSGGTLPTWNTTTDYFDIAPNDGDEIVAVEKNEDLLLFFKRRSLYVWDGSTLSFVDYVGTVTQEVVQTIKKRTYFLSSDSQGILSVQEYYGGEVNEVSQPIQSWLSAYSDATISIPAAARTRGQSNFIGAWKDSENYTLYLGDVRRYDRQADTGVLNKIFKNVFVTYNISTKQWEEGSINKSSTSNDSNRLFFSTQVVSSTIYKNQTVVGGSYSGTTSATQQSLTPYIWNYRSSSDSPNGFTEDKIKYASGGTYPYVPIEIHIQSIKLDFGSLGRLKTVNKFSVFCQGNSSGLEVSYRVDNGEWRVLGELQSGKNDYSIGESGYTFEYRISGTLNGEAGSAVGSKYFEHFILDRIEFYDVDIEEYNV